MEVFIPTCFTGIPFENARRAYYADKSWPVELRRGYTSPLNALLRIPFEEGLGYLFKGGFPIWSHSFVFWTAFCTYYSFCKNKFFFLWVYQDFSYNYIKAGMMGISFGLASLMAYPLYFTRTMVDLWPKERGGHCTWKNSYREAAKWMILNMDQLYFNFLSGYATWFRRYGISYSIALWMADNLGMFSNVSEPWLSMESMSPISAESV
jgi:solute carrier family 25 oxoglutarate transporter 11